MSRILLVLLFARKIIESLMIRSFAEIDVVLPPIVKFPETFKSCVMFTVPVIVPPEDENFVFATVYAEFACA
jgi:hypothetical protein